MEFLPKLFNTKDSFSDVSIKLNNGKILTCHKNILGAQSEFFKKMFSSPFEETNLKTIEIDEDSLSMEIILKYMYRIKETITLENAVGLFVVSHKYEFDFLTSECKKFILGHLNKELSLDLLNLSKTYNWIELREKTLTLMLNEMDPKERNQVFTFEDWKIILKTKRSHIKGGVDKNQIDFFRKIEDWILFDVSRKKNMFELFDLINYSQIPDEDILQFGNGKLSLGDDSMTSYLFRMLQKKKNLDLKPKTLGVGFEKVIVQNVRRAGSGTIIQTIPRIGSEKVIVQNVPRVGSETIIQTARPKRKRDALDLSEEF
jgi:hypothetical protein